MEERLAQLGRELPGPMTGFARLHKKAVEDGALSAKTKELMALAIGVAVRCEGCIAYHVHDAIKAGATRQELLETIGVAIMMGGGPALMYAAHALDAIEQFMTRPTHAGGIDGHQRAIIILPAPGCRRSRKVIEYLEAHGIPFTRIELESPEGQALAAQHDLRASPGILVDDVSVNPFDLLIQSECRVDEDKAREIFANADRAA